MTVFLQSFYATNNIFLILLSVAAATRRRKVFSIDCRIVTLLESYGKI